MKILITGALGFVGKNLVARLQNIISGKCKTSPLSSEQQLFLFDIDTEKSLLSEYCRQADFVLHLAGVNRPKEQSEFMQGNFGFTSELLNELEKHNNKCPVMISSSTQAALDNPYGISKKAGEQLMREYSKRSGAKVLIYRFPNIFGKWCRPNYNSAVATFCNNIANRLPITVNDPSVNMTLVYIDDVVDELINALAGKENTNGEFCEVPITHKITLGGIVELLYSFDESRKTLASPDCKDAFAKKLYATYLSYLPENDFAYELVSHNDARGSFTEFMRSDTSGQVSVNISKKGIVKGNHWHDTKVEKFLVVYGEGIIRFRKVTGGEVIEYKVSGEKLTVVDIPAGYTHNIENTGETDMVTLMWCSECFNPQKPDTYALEV